MHANSSNGRHAAPDTGYRLLRLFEDLPSRTLMQIVGHSDPEDEGVAAFMLTLAGTASWLQEELSGVLRKEGLTDRAFGVLLVLYTLDPSPVSQADLAFHAGVARTSLHGLLDGLIAAGLVERQADRRRRGVSFVSLTAAGQDVTAKALRRYLGRLAEVGRRLEPDVRMMAASTCVHLRGLEKHKPAALAAD